MFKIVEFKVLLALNKFPRCPPELDITHPHIQVKYLLHSTNSLVRMHDQGIITNFRSYHTHRTFYTMLGANEETLLSVSECWKWYGVVDHCMVYT